MNNNIYALRYPEANFRREYETGHSTTIASAQYAANFDATKLFDAYHSEHLKRLMIAPAVDYIGENANETRVYSYGLADEAIKAIGQLPLQQRIQTLRELKNDTNYTRAARMVGMYAVNAFTGSRAIDHIKVDALGFEFPTKFSNALLEGHIEGFAAAASSEYYGFLERHRGFTDGIQTAGTHTLTGKEASNKEAWLSHKALTFGVMLEQFYGFYKICEQVKRTDDTEQSRLTNDHLFDLTRNLQTYDVKQGIAPSINPEHDIQEWHVSNYRSNNGIYKLPGSIDPAKEALAVFHGTSGKYLSDKLAVSHIDTAHEDYSVQFATFDTDHTSDTANIIAAFVLMPDGNLVTVRGQSLYQIAEENGALDEYESIRTELLCIYHDLTVPTVNIKTSNNSTDKSEGYTLGDPIALRNLALKRIKYMVNNSKEIQDEIDKEGFGQKVMIGSDVVGHTRELPSHYRASAEARKNYFEATGKVLPLFGKTYVQSHIRGVIEPEFKGYIMTYEEVRQSVAREFQAVRKRTKGKGSRFTPPKLKR